MLLHSIPQGVKLFAGGTLRPALEAEVPDWVHTVCKVNSSRHLGFIFVKRKNWPELSGGNGDSEYIMNTSRSIVKILRGPYEVS